MPAARSQIRAHPLAYVGLGALLLFSVTAFAYDISDSIDLMRHLGEYARPPFYLGDANWGAVALQPEAEAAGLKWGDKVLTVDGHPMDGFVVYYVPLRRARGGDRLYVQTGSQDPGDTQVRDVSIDLRAFRGESNPSADFPEYVTFALRVVILPVVCITLGFWVAAVRIGDASAWLLLVLLLSFPSYVGAGGIGPLGWFGRDAMFQPLFAGFGALRQQVLPAALLLFGIAFPERLALDRRFPWVKWIVAGYLVIVSTLVAIDVGLWTHHLAWARQVTQRPIQWLTGVEGNLGAAISGLAVIMGAASLGWKAFSAPSHDARRRLLLLFAGAVPGSAALLVILMAGRFDYSLPVWPLMLLLTMMMTFPLTMAYVIVVHRAMDVRVVVRQGVQYLLARGGIRALQLALLVAVIIEATSLLSGKVGFARVAVVVAGTVAMGTITGRFAARLRGWVDRRFFREAYEADVILSDLATQVRTMVETKPLLETVATRIAQSLHVPRVAILLDGGGAFQPAYALGYGSLPFVAIPAESMTVKRLRGQPHALVHLDDGDSWIQETEGAERRALEELKPELLMPLALNERVLGILSVGPKQSEEPFSKTDLRLLDSVATQTGLALENSRLTAEVAAEVAARAKQTRDLEIARAVQQRLFPQEYPPVAGLEYAGSCRAALGVGGDYYDFILLSQTRLGLAIGDVSGKGIPASLLMATLRAYLRGVQTIHHQADLTAVMRHLNTLVYESSDANRYATFFYGEFDATSRTLTYVNAGHNPPMVFRQADGRRQVLRLDTGGPVVGLMDACDYRQGSVTLEPGDLLVAFTDGISEAMNAADEEWGEERFMDAVWSNRAATARTLIDAVMISADKFAAGAPQHDDMTLLVVRVRTSL